MKLNMRHPFEANFDVSVVLPFYKKLEVFGRTLLINHPYFQRNGIEVIIVMDEPSEQEGLLRLIKKFPLINWRIIVNENPHAWRNPSKAINVGIRHASKKYILVMGPDSEMADDIIFIMRGMAEDYAGSFFVGRVAFVDYEYAHSKHQHSKFKPLFYGSIFVERQFLVAINGYDESFEQWGGDDDNVRARLQRYGLKKIKMPSCLLLHRESKDELEAVRKKEKSALVNRDIAAVKNSYLPGNYLANRIADWGRDFSKVIYDWTNNPYAEELCRSYLRSHGLDTYELQDNAHHRDYSVIALLSVYNEKRHVPDVLVHLDQYCDGIILLDDASEDGTYALAKSEKLILKVRKPYRDGFDDLLNRNILLDIASFFKSAYYFFLDADERLEERYADLHAVVRSDKSETYCFYLVHLWDDEMHYRVDVPERGLKDQPGVLQRWRMFKNIGRTNIKGDRLHFEATPYKTSPKNVAPILVKHYGLMDREIREMKYQRYLSEDEKLALRPDKYDYFLHEEVQVRKVDRVVLPGS